MNAGHLHLISNHFPIVGLILFTPLFFYALMKNKEELMRVCCVVIFLLSLVSIVTYNTGEAAEDLVEEVPGISHEVIHEHEEAGEKAFWIVNVTGMLAIVILAGGIRNTGKGKWAYIALGVLLVLSVAVCTWTGYLGGRIRHTEEYAFYLNNQLPLYPTSYAF